MEYNQWKLWIVILYTCNLWNIVHQLCFKLFKSQPVLAIHASPKPRAKSAVCSAQRNYLSSTAVPYSICNKFGFVFPFQVLNDNLISVWIPWVSCLNVGRINSFICSLNLPLLPFRCLNCAWCLGTHRKTLYNSFHRGTLRPGNTWLEFSIITTVPEDQTRATEAKRRK